MQTIVETTQQQTLPPMYLVAETVDADSFDEPRARRWTKDEYYKLAESGFFAGKNTELIDGEIIEMPTMKSPHATAVSLTDEALRQTFAAGFVVRSQLPLDFDADEVVPDIAVVGGKIRDYKEAHPTTAILVVEVADTTLRYDRTTKQKLYAQKAIREYWIVNINHRTLEVYRRPVADGYADVSVFYEQDAVAPLAAPDARISVADLLP